MNVFYVSYLQLTMLSIERNSHPFQLNKQVEKKRNKFNSLKQYINKMDISPTYFTVGKYVNM